MKVVAALFGYLACVVIGSLGAGEWTEWSTWSGCSRTCGGGGGIASQSRRCLGDDATGNQCNNSDGGQGIRYRICGGIQSCRSADSDDDDGSEEDVCSALEDVLIDGKAFKWTSTEGGRGGGGSGGDCSASCSPVNASSAVVEPSVRVTRPDGTRCRRHRLRLGGSDGDAPGSTSATGTTTPTPQSGQGGVCVAGVCRSVDCDGVIGPTDALDACEICRADGPTTTCSSSKVDENPPPPLVVYEWRESGYSACSASCGIGEQSVAVVCRDVTNDVLVSDEFCRLSSTAGDKPHRMRVCVGPDCENDRTIWITDEWQGCSRSCDGGRSLRSVYCVLRSGVDGSYERTDDDLCRRKRKPDTERKCNDFECPKWIAGQWSHCSVSCGGVSGVQQRAVVCKRTDAIDCVEAERPDTRRTCRVLSLCPYRHSEIWSSESADPRAAYGGLRDFDSVFDINGRLISDFERGNEVAEHAAPDHQPNEETSITTTRGDPSTRKSETKYEEEEEDATQTASSTPTPFSSLESSPATVEKEEEKETLELNHTKQDVRLQTSNNGEAILEPDPRNRNQSLPTYDDEFEAEYNTGGGGGIDREDGGEIDASSRVGPPVENKKPTSVPSFVVSEWSSCSATCGVAQRRRKVVCKVLLEHPKTVQELPDFKCQGSKPKLQDYCELPDCASKPAEPKTYSWIITSYGPCSKTCGGGSQDGEFNCVRIPQYYKVETIRCLRQPNPGRVKRPCNMLPCPPRWNPLPYGPCSVSCGGGQQMRQLQCVQDTHDQKMKIVPDAECKDAVSPATSAPCNLVPCPAKWTIGNWTKCSVTCGQGIQTREIRCEQKLSLHQSVVVDDVSCWQQTDKPDTERVCEAGKCHALNSLRARSTAIRSENSNFVQLRPLKSVSLTVGTNASLIAGCLVTIHCPVAAAKRNSSSAGAPKVVWRENDRPIDERKRRRLRVDRHGSLHVRNSRASDRGVYACFAGGDAANTTIAFHGVDDSMRELRTRANFLQDVDKKTRASYSEDFVRNFQSELKRLFAKTRRRATYSGRFLMSKMAANVVPLQYVPFGWSQCSAECGGGGIQSRDVVCTIMADEFILEVDDGFCSDRRLQKPIGDRDCGFGRCPRWEPGPWGQCVDDNCVAVGTGERRREFHCVSAAGERLDVHRCRDQPKPNDREDCPNDQCIAVWKPSNWTQCSITCGGRGLKTRTFQCIWRQSKKPVAESLCSLHSKPTSSKSCFVTTPCPSADCRDESRHCRTIPGFQMCRYPQYRQECCQSCSLVRVNTSQQTTASNSFVHK